MKRFFLLFFIFMIYMSCFSAPVYNVPNILIQPDGTEIFVFYSGDEFHNRAHCENNYTIIQDEKTGFWCWANVENGDLVSTGKAVHLYEVSSLNISPGLTISKEKYLQRRALIDNTLNLRNDVRTPSTGVLNNLVIFIRFAGESDFDTSFDYYEGMFNQPGTNVNSMYQYFFDASYQQLQVYSHFYPAPTGNVILSYQSPNDRSYYEPYNAVTNPNGYQPNQRTQREHQLLAAAVSSVASQIPVNLNIDSDNDGFVDNVCFVIKGSTGAWADLLWPHRWVLFSQFVYIRDKRVYDYNFQLENHMNVSGVSVLAHEMTHSFGAPDFYRYENEGTPVGMWDLMAYNTNPAQSISAFTKYKYTDWISNIPEITVSGTYTLYPNTVSATNHAYKVESPYSETEYFILEYRSTQTGLTDSALPGSGLLVYRINTNAGNGNAQGPPDEMYVYRLDGSVNGDGNIHQAFLSAQSGRTEFNDTTNPGCYLSNGANGGLNISQISSAGETVSFYIDIEGTEPISTYPWTEGFTGNVFPLGWTTYNDGNGNNWTVLDEGGNPGANMRYNFHSQHSANAWAFSKALSLQADITYQLSFDQMVFSGSYPEKLKITIGTEQNTTSQASVLWNNSNLINTAWQTHSVEFTVNNSGIYYLGFHCYSNADMWTLVLDNISVSESQSNNAQLSVNLTSNWNIFSTNLIPQDFSINSVFSYLLNNNHLQKIQDQAGNSYEYIEHINQWVNNIGNIQSNQGYRIKVTENTTFTIEGIPVSFPFTVLLTEGWNLIPNPYPTQQQAIGIFESHINQGSIIKVLDESGNAIEYISSVGLINNIQSLMPGKAYAVRATQDMPFSYPQANKNMALLNEKKQDPVHFQKVWTGNGWQHFNLYIMNNNYLMSNLSSGDEIAVFDGEYCVGASVYDGNNNFISIVTSLNENINNVVNGYTPGNEWSLRIWKAEENIEISEIESEIIQGPATFQVGGTTVININEFTDVVDLTLVPPDLFVSIYPNPFSTESKIKIKTIESSFIEIDIYNIKGQKLKSVFSGIHKSNAHEYKVNLTNYSSGIYFARINLKDRQVIVKLLKIK